MRPERQWQRNLTAQRQVATLDPAELALLGAIERGRDDFRYFCEKVLGVRVHDGQLRVVQSLGAKPFLTLAAANSWGKSALIALLTLWAGFYKKWADPLWQPYRVVVLGPEMKHSLLVYSEIEGIRLGRSRFQNWGDGKPPRRCLIADMIQPFTTPDKHHAMKWKHNGSLMFFESSEERAKSIEGMAPNMVIYDEVRRELYLDFVVNQVILPRGNRVPGFRMMLSSTPLADSFDFMEFVKRGEDGTNPDWSSIRGKIADNTFLDKKAVDLIRRNLDPRIAEQVMSGDFVAPESAYFIGEKVLACMDDDPLPAVLETPVAEANHRYVGGIDPAVAEGGDASAVTVWDITATPYRVVYERVIPRGSSLGSLLDLTNQLVDVYNCIFAFDATGPLGVEMQHQTMSRPTYYMPVSFGAGHRASDITSSQRTSVMKQDVLGNFRYLINNGLWHAPNLTELRKEILGYKLDDKHLRTDRLMAQALAAWLAKDYLAPSDKGLTLPNLWDQYTDIPEDDPLYAGGSQLMRRWKEWLDNTPPDEERV